MTANRSAYKTLSGWLKRHAGLLVTAIGVDGYVMAIAPLRSERGIRRRRIFVLGGEHREGLSRRREILGLPGEEITRCIDIDELKEAPHTKGGIARVTNKGKKK